MLILLACLFLSVRYLDSQPLSIFIFVLLIAPFIFLKALMKLFTRKAVINLESDKISFDITKLNGDEEKETQTYNLADIDSYQIQFPNSRFVCLILKLRSGNKQVFSWRRQGETSENTNTVIESIHKFLEQHQIAFAPSFFASKTGLYTIIVLTLFLCVPFILAINQHKILPLTIFASIAMMAQIISRRANDLRFYNKWKKP